MSMSDALLWSLQRWITDHGYPMRTLCYVSLQAVDPLPLPITRCLGVLTNIPVFTFFPLTVSLSRTLLAMFDWLSYNWLMAQIQKPFMEFKLVITLIHEEWRHSWWTIAYPSMPKPRGSLMTSKAWLWFTLRHAHVSKGHLLFDLDINCSLVCSIYNLQTLQS